MKKTYQKPMLIAESFVLFEHISNGCLIDKANGVQASYLDNTNCAYWDNDIAIYTNNVVACKTSMDEWIDPAMGMKPDDPSTWGAACYNAFGSFSHPFVS